MPYPDAMGPSSIAIGSATSAFIGFMPRFSEIRRSDPGDDGMKKDVQLGEIASVAVSLGIGVIVSNVTGSPVPAIVAAVMCAILIACYNAALRSK